MSGIEEVRGCEERLLRAMRTSDFAELDALLADDLRFVAHTGATIDKAMDLGMHRSGMVVLNVLDFTKAQEYREFGEVVLTVSHARLEGTIGGAAFVDFVVYTRLWRRNAAGAWQVAAGQATRFEEGKQP